jgi:hypothetical protein
MNYYNLALVFTRGAGFFLPRDMGLIKAPFYCLDIYAYIYYSTYIDS